MKDPDGTNLIVQTVPVPKPVFRIPGRESRANFEIVFKAESVPPLGFKSFHVTKKSSLGKLQMSRTEDLLSRRASNLNIRVKMKLKSF